MSLGAHAMYEPRRAVVNARVRDIMLHSSDGEWNASSIFVVSGSILAF